MSTKPDNPRKRRGIGKRKLLLLLIPVGIAILIWAGFAAADAYRVERDVRAGRAELAGIADIGILTSGHVHDRAVAAMRRFESAQQIAAGSKALGLWAHVPFFGRPARWIRAATEATVAISRDATEAIGRIEPVIGTKQGPSGRLALLHLLEDQLSSLRASIADVHLPSTGEFLPPVNASDHELKRDFARLTSALNDGINGVRGLESMLEGPTTYLVLAANNAEMRAGGMVLQAGVFTSNQGRMSAGYFFPTSSLTLKKPVAVPQQIESLYGWLSPGTEWRNVGSSPDFPVTAGMYAAMAKSVGGHSVDGVIQIDVLGMRALLEIVGPVDVLGQRYTAANVGRLVLHDLYARYGTDQVERRRDFSLLATAIFQALNDRSWHLDTLVRALRDAARGRHLMAWSDRPVEQAGWRSLGMDGSLDPNGLMLTVQNHTGNKLDWFVRPQVDVRIDKRSGGWRRFHVRVHIANPTPAGEPSYIAGDGSLVPPGAYRALVVLYLPGWATDLEMPGRTVALVGEDGPMRVIGTRLDIARGSSADLEIDFSAPPREHRIDLLPSARAWPVPYFIEKRRLDDAVPNDVAI